MTRSMEKSSKTIATDRSYSYVSINVAVFDQMQSEAFNGCINTLSRVFNGKKLKPLVIISKI